MISLQGVVSVGDYDGVISQLDLHSGHWLGDREESDGSRYARTSISSPIRLSKITNAHYYPCP